MSAGSWNLTATGRVKKYSNLAATVLSRELDGLTNFRQETVDSMKHEHLVGICKVYNCIIYIQKSSINSLSTLVSQFE
jgi:hypothetical protein